MGIIGSLLFLVSSIDNILLTVLSDLVSAQSKVKKSTPVAARKLLD